MVVVISALLALAIVSIVWVTIVRRRQNKLSNAGSPGYLDAVRELDRWGSPSYAPPFELTQNPLYHARNDFATISLTENPLYHTRNASNGVNERFSEYGRARALQAPLSSSENWLDLVYTSNAHSIGNLKTTYITPALDSNIYLSSTKSGNEWSTNDINGSAKYEFQA